MEIYNPTSIGTSIGFGIPTGGTSGQVLQKIDGTNYNTRWATTKTKVTKILDNATYANASSWLVNYTGSGGTVLVQAFATGYATATGNKTLSLKKNGVDVAVCTFYFNSTSVHMTLPTLNYVGTNESGTNSYSIFFTGITADTADYATIVITEYF